MTHILSHETPELMDEPVIDLVADSALQRAALAGAERAGERSGTRRSSCSTASANFSWLSRR
jgi:hypothetical protein